MSKTHNMVKLHYGSNLNIEDLTHIFEYIQTSWHNMNKSCLAKGVFQLFFMTRNSVSTLILNMKYGVVQPGDDGEVLGVTNLIFLMWLSTLCSNYLKVIRMKYEDAPEIISAASDK